MVSTKSISTKWPCNTCLASSVRLWAWCQRGPRLPSIDIWVLDHPVGLTLYTTSAPRAGKVLAWCRWTFLPVPWQHIADSGPHSLINEANLYKWGKVPLPPQSPYSRAQVLPIVLDPFMNLCRLLKWNGNSENCLFGNDDFSKKDLGSSMLWW